MALKDIWSDKTDGKSYAVAKDINNIAHAVIELEEAETELTNTIGDIETALDGILEIQASLIGGNT